MNKVAQWFERIKAVQWLRNNIDCDNSISENSWVVLRGLKSWFLAKNVSGRSVSSNVYLILWFPAMFIAAYAYYQIVQKEFVGGQWWAAIGFGSLTLVQQGLVYHDFHKIEDGSDSAAMDYDPWLNVHLERLIRYIIIFGLLLGAGKIASVFYPMLGCHGDIGSRGDLCEWLEPDGVSKDRLFAIGCMFVFVALFFWNIGALFHRPEKMGKEEKKDRIRVILVTARIIVFLFLTATCAVFWFLVFLTEVQIANIFSWFVFLAYIGGVALLLSLRCERSLNWFIDKFGNWFE